MLQITPEDVVVLRQDCDTGSSIHLAIHGQPPDLGSWLSAGSWVVSSTAKMGLGVIRHLT